VVFTGGISTETNTFAPFPTTLEDWRTSDNPESYADKGIFDLIEDAATCKGWETIRGFGACAEPAGKTTADAYQHLKERLLDDLRSAMPVDLVVLFLHGAMIAEDCDDCEGDILASIREIVGPDVPIGAGLDAHAHLTEQMREKADILVFMKEWPHIDIPETIEKAFHLTADCAEGRVVPHMAVSDCRMVAPYHTLEEPVKSVVRQMRAAEKHGDVLSVSFIHGFWFADVPDMGSKVLVITDSSPKTGATLAEDFARNLYQLRGRTHPSYLALTDALDVIKTSTAHPVVVADIGDIPGGGAPGDATFVLQGLVDHGIENAAVAYLWDPLSLDMANEAGEGAEIDLRIGGRSCERSGSPVSLRCKVDKILEDLWVGEGVDATWVGDVTVVQACGIDIVLARERVAALGSGHFDAVGIDAAAKDVLIVKSANNFFAGFIKIAGQIIYVDAGGVTSGSIKDMELSRVRRPFWPLDDAPFGRP